MADILIKDMEMPKVCAECPFHSMPELFMLETNRYSYISRCVRAPEEIEDPWREIVWQMEHKESWCPIIQLQPHGRLIDADEFYKSLKKWIVRFYSAYEKDKKDERIAALFELDLAVRAVLADCPTIIPASEVKDND